MSRELLKAKKKKEKKKKLRVLIIGSGMAGLAAGRELQTRGHFVQVLEARDRVGGRIHTLKMNMNSQETPVDTGAAFIHGIQGNPVADLASMIGLHFVPVKKCILFDMKGHKISKNTDVKIQKLFNDVLDRSSAKRRNSENRERSLGSMMHEILRDEFPALTDEETRIFHWHATNLEFANAAPLSNLSNEHWDQDDDYEMHGDHCSVDLGFSSLMEAMASSLKVHLNTVVKTISYSTRGVNVNTSKGSFTGDAVVVTVPLGVLKSDRTNVRSISFHPPLPIAKIQSIQRLGFGVVNKVILHFDKVFWDPSDFLGVTSDYDLLKKHEPSKSSNFFLFVNANESMLKKPILTCIVTSTYAFEIESKSDEEILMDIMIVLRRMYPGASRPQEMIVTRWYKDPYARGAYSYIPVGASGEDYDVLAEPLCRGNDEDGHPTPRVLFAGEGTIRNYPATIHGAFISGVREARRIDKIAQFDRRPMPYSFRLPLCKDLPKRFHLPADYENMVRSWEKKRAEKQKLEFPEESKRIQSSRCVSLSFMDQCKQLEIKRTSPRKSVSSRKSQRRNEPEWVAFLRQAHFEKTSFRRMERYTLLAIKYAKTSRTKAQLQEILSIAKSRCNDHVILRKHISQILKDLWK